MNLFEATPDAHSLFVCVIVILSSMLVRLNPLSLNRWRGAQSPLQQDLIPPIHTKDKQYDIT